MHARLASSCFVYLNGHSQYIPDITMQPCHRVTLRNRVSIPLRSPAEAATPPSEGTILFRYTALSKESVCIGRSQWMSKLVRKALCLLMGVKPPLPGDRSLILVVFL